MGDMLDKIVVPLKQKHRQQQGNEAAGDVGGNKVRKIAKAASISSLDSTNSNDSSTNNSISEDESEKGLASLSRVPAVDHSAIAYILFSICILKYHKKLNLRNLKTLTFIRFGLDRI